VVDHRFGEDHPLKILQKSEQSKPLPFQSFKNNEIIYLWKRRRR
jgi:hypothetical protein